MKQKRQGKDSTFALPAICPAPEAEQHPLSFYQKQIWRHRGSTNNVIVHATWKGKVDQTLFARVLEELQAEHSTLRTTFREETAGPTQQVQACLPLDYKFTDVIEGMQLLGRNTVWLWSIGTRSSYDKVRCTGYAWVVTATNDAN